MTKFTKCMMDHLNQSPLVKQAAKGYIAMGGLLLLKQWIMNQKPTIANNIFIILGDLAFEQIEWDLILDSLE
jgi:hypothetical protein